MMPAILDPQMRLLLQKPYGTTRVDNAIKMCETSLLHVQEECDRSAQRSRSSLDPQNLLWFLRDCVDKEMEAMLQAATAAARAAADMDRPGRRRRGLPGPPPTCTSVF